MSNASTIRRQVSGTQQLTLAPIVNPSTTETNFALNNNGLTLTGGGVIPLVAGVTGLYQGTGQVLHIRLAGTYSGVTGGTTTLDIKLYEVPASVIAAGLTQTSQTSFNKIADSAALGAANASGTFTLDARVQLDGAGNLQGQFTADIDSTASVAAWQKLSNNVTGLVGEADLNFVLAGQFGVAETGDVANLNEFSLNFV